MKNFLKLNWFAIVAATLAPIALVFLALAKINYRFFWENGFVLALAWLDNLGAIPEVKIK